MTTTTRHNHVGHDICSQCGGKCCKDYPGAAYPEDFDTNVMESVNVAIASGNYAIDSWEGDPRPNEHEFAEVYFVRPAIVGVISIYDPSCGGTCVFLEDDGCRLSASERRRGCRMLKPCKDGHCMSEDLKHSDNPKADAAIAWIPYQAELEELLQGS